MSPLSLSLVNLLELSCYIQIWMAKFSLVPLTWMQMLCPSLNKDWAWTKSENHSLWREPAFSCVLPRHQTHKANTLFHFPETTACPFWCLGARFFLLLLCPVHTKCKLSIRPILEIFHLGPTCFPYMWCSFNTGRGRSWPSQETPLTSERRYSLFI